jgi:hypothetical protein
MAPKYGNWNAAQLSDAEIHKQAADDRAAKVGSICSVARKMFDVLCESDLTAEDRTAAVQILNVLSHRIAAK